MVIVQKIDDPVSSASLLQRNQIVKLIAVGDAAMAGITSGWIGA